MQTTGKLGVCFASNKRDVTTQDCLALLLSYCVHSAPAFSYRNLKFHWLYWISDGHSGQEYLDPPLPVCTLGAACAEDDLSIDGWLPGKGYLATADTYEIHAWLAKENYWGNFLLLELVDCGGLKASSITAPQGCNL